MPGGAHHLFQEVYLGQSRCVRLEEPVVRRYEIDLPFPRLAFSYHPRAAEGIGHGKGSVIFVELPFLDLEDVQMAFPQPLQMADVRLADLVALPKRRPLELASADFGDIVGKNGPYGVFNIDYPLAHIRS